MHELTDHELYQAFSYARSLDEGQGKQIMARLALDQPGLYQTLFGVFPAIIAEHHQEMAYLFMDLCFDVLCVFQYLFGELPYNGNDPVWLEKQAVLVDIDLQALIRSDSMDAIVWKNLQDRFTKPSPHEFLQTGLVTALNEAIDGHAALNTSRVQATKITQNLMFVVVKLLCTLYNSPTKH